MQRTYQLPSNTHRPLRAAEVALSLLLTGMVIALLARGVALVLGFIA